LNSAPAPEISPLSNEPTPKPDDIRIKYHLHSGRSPEIFHFEDYGRSPSAPEKTKPLNSAPWEPFCSRIDFEFAELALHAALNKEQTDTLIRLVHKVQEQRDSFTLASHAELNEIWKKASVASIPVGIITCS
jgi:hypothetical protein